MARTKKPSYPDQSVLIAEGQKLASLDAKEMKSLRTKTTKVVRNKDSLDYQLGKVQDFILKVENVKVISKELAKKYGIHTIDRRRRSEALWLFRNFTEVNAWLDETKKRFINLSSLQKAFNKATKPKTDEPKAQEETETESQDSPTTDTDEPKAQEEKPKKLTVSEIALETLVQIDVNNIDMKDFLNELQKQFLENKQISEVA
tara:strand:- start:932 stop:1540 length:609 start_codon:yes stop_codon:yes gene_type:complete